jgi:hypothetical protein
VGVVNALAEPVSLEVPSSSSSASPECCHPLLAAVVLTRRFRVVVFGSEELREREEGGQPGQPVPPWTSPVSLSG